MTSFASIALPPPLAKAVEVLGFGEMTPVQAQTLPPLLAGQDVIAQARAGSGKTVAFGLALLARLRSDAPVVQALVLCPTRELADQVGGEIRRLARFIPNVRLVTLCGGVPVRTQRPALEQAPHVLVGTPGRILDHLRRGTVVLDALDVLVLDEADRMLDMGFLEDIQEVVARAPAARQTMLFSATYTDEVRAVSRRLQRAPVEITVAQGADEIAIEQILYEVEPPDRFEALTALLAQHQADPALVFCHTRNDARALAERLSGRGHDALTLHGELDQRDRDEVLLRFAHGSCAVLVATDVAARGLDIKGLPLVISWELPTDPDVHTHRIGRTGRAGRPGLALALCGPRERARAAAIEARQGRPMRREPLPPAPPAAPPAPAPMVTLLVEGGRQEKLRPGDLLGAFTGELGLPGDAVGKIDVGQTRAYVSIARARAEATLQAIRGASGRIKVKGKAFRVSRLHDRTPR
jgi:ATP-independent RNA helicase DbpA